MVGAAHSPVQPRTHRRFAGLLRAGVNCSDRRVVVDRLSVHGFDQANIIRNRGGVRDEFTEPASMLPMLGKFKHWGHAGEGGLFGSHPGDSLTIADTVGQFLPVVFTQLGMIIKHIDMGRPTGHEQINYPFCGRFEMGAFESAG